jgi:hypothetical protein
MNAFKLILALIFAASLVTTTACGEKDPEDSGTATDTAS